ncbi:MAG TPA: DsbA family protein [Chitinophagaceae bacterium]
MSLTPPVSSIDHLWGNKNALIELVEYGDFQCPYCGRAYPIIKRLKVEMNDSVKFIFRNFPISKIHPQAKAAAIAAEAAALQNKFWEMHDLIFEHQKRLTHEAIVEYAHMAGLDLNRFNEDIQHENLLRKVEGDFMSGLRSGVNATPTFFINGSRYEGSWEGNYLSEYLLNISQNAQRI